MHLWEIPITPIFYKRFFYNKYKQWYWLFRIDILNGRLSIQFFKHENMCWDINRLLKIAIDSIRNNAPIAQLDRASVYETGG